MNSEEEETDYSETSEYSSGSEDSENDMQLPPSIYKVSDDEGSDNEPVPKQTASKQPPKRNVREDIKTKKQNAPLVKNISVEKKKKQESSSSSSESSSSVSETEEESPPKKRRSIEKKKEEKKTEDKNVRDSLIGNLFDKRKLRRTPMPSLDQLGTPRKSNESKETRSSNSRRESAKKKKSPEKKSKSSSSSSSSSPSESSSSSESSESSPDEKRNSKQGSRRSSVIKNPHPVEPPKVSAIPPQRRFSVQPSGAEQPKRTSQESQSSRSSVKSEKSKAERSSSEKSPKSKGLSESERLAKLEGQNKRSSSQSKSETESESGSESESSSESESEETKSRTQSENDNNTKESGSEDEEKVKEKKKKRSGEIKDRTRADEIREQMKEEETKEKRELIYEFWLMEKQGIPVSKKYTTEDNIDEMRFEYHRLKSEGDIRDKIKLGWSMFSCVNSIGEMINQKFKPLGISMEGWSEELDSQRQEYEKVFRKIYKNMASRFYVRPGLQLMMMFGSQLLLFIAPRFLKKFQKKDEDEPRVQELDEKGNPIPPETVRKISELQTNVLEIRNQFSDQLAKMQQQQLILLQAQQKFFESVTNLLNNNMRTMQQPANPIEKVSPIVEEPPKETPKQTPRKENTPSKKITTEKKLPIPDSKKATPVKAPEVPVSDKKDESEYEYEYVEVTDDETEHEKSNAEGITISNGQKITKADEDASNSIGEVITQMQPLVNMFRALKTKDKDVPLNEYMYDKPPEIPETMKEQHEELKKKGFITEETAKVEEKPQDTTIEHKEVSEKKTPETTRKSSKRLETWNLD